MMNTQSPRSLTTILSLGLGFMAAGACTAVETDEFEAEALEAEAFEAEAFEAELVELELVDDPSPAASGLTCTEQLTQDEIDCALDYDENADFACCMAYAGCILNVTRDYCDCLYSFGSPEHTTCYSDAAGEFGDDKRGCKILFPY